MKDDKHFNYFTELATGQVTGQATEQATGQVTGQVSGGVSEEIKRVVLVIYGELKNVEIQNILQLKHREYFRDNYLLPSLDTGYIEMTYPDNPNHPNQRYRLTAKGLALKQTLSKSKRKKRNN